jgi:hypothetical protein
MKSPGLRRPGLNGQKAGRRGRWLRLWPTQYQGICQLQFRTMEQDNAPFQASVAPVQVVGAYHGSTRIQSIYVP